MHPLHPLASTSLSTPAGTYIYTLTRATPSLLAAISSDDSLRLFSPTTLDLQHTLQHTHTGTTCLARISEHVLATAGRDGAVRVWDVRAGDRAVGGYKGASGAPVLSLAVGAGVVAAGTELVGSKVCVTVWDVRSAGVKVQYTESHNDDITTLAFHPTVPYLLLSGGTDALVSIYDLRMPPGEAGEADDEEALWQVVNHGSSVHRAGWVGGDVFALSHDEVLAVYKLVERVPEDGEEAGEVEKRGWGDVRGVLGCEYVVDVVPRGEGGGVVVAGSGSGGWVDLVGLEREGSGVAGWGMGAGAGAGAGVRLVGGHGEEVCRGVYLDEGVGGALFRGVILGGGG